MAGAASDGHGGAGGAVDRADDAERGAILLEDWTLLDVELEIGEGVWPAGVQLAGVAAEGAQRVSERDAVGVACIEPGGVEAAGARVRTGQGDGEAHTFLVAEGPDLDREGERAGGRQRLDGGDDAEAPVVAAGVAHGVEVGTKQQDRAVGSRSRPRSDEGRRRVEPGCETRIVHPRPDECGRVPVRG